MIVYLQMIETNEDKSKFEEIYQEYRNLVVNKEKNAAFTVVMGRLVIKGDAVPAAILSKGVW